MKPGEGVCGILIAGLVHSVHKVRTEGKDHTPECRRWAKLLSQLGAGATGSECNTGAHG